MNFEIKPLNGNIGAEIIGLDLNKAITDATRQDLYDTWLDKGILLFRGIGTSPEKQLALSRCFGEHEVHPIEDIRVDDYPELIWLASNGKRTAPVYYYDEVATVGRIPWHTDLVYTTTPNRGALLRMINLPAQGGETGWIDTAAVYDALPQATKERIEDLEVKFEFILDPAEMRFIGNQWQTIRKGSEGDIQFPEFPDVVHPLVWIHQESHRKALSISTLHLRQIIGLDQETGDALLEELVNLALQPQFRYIHQWQVNDMVLWDNWRTMHSALGHPPGHARLVHRTTLKSDHAYGRLAE